MQYDIDIRGEHADTFRAVRKLLLGYPQITELKNAKQTSYRDEYGVVVMMRGKGESLILAFGRGTKLQEKFPMLEGDGKIVRHLTIRNLSELDEALLREILEESFVLGMEAEEMKKLKKSLHRV